MANRGNGKYMVGQIVLCDAVIDERFIFEKQKTVFLPLKKQVTKKGNNCRDLESKSKRK